MTVCVLVSNLSASAHSSEPHTVLATEPNLVHEGPDDGVGYLKAALRTAQPIDDTCSIPNVAAARLGTQRFSDKGDHQELDLAIADY
jgi:hypothetical protein